MEFQIREKDDINEGSILTVRIPEEQLDRNALYTMEEDRPAFVVPFTYRNVDGEIEISYKLGNWSQLRYFSREKTVTEYCELFRKILLPLQNCEDWFMKPFSFLLSAEHVYFQQDTQSVAYVYIPAKESCSSRSDLVAMVKLLNKQFPADNSDFKVKVLESLDDFRIRSFLDMLKEGAKPAQPSEPEVKTPVVNVTREEKVEVVEAVKVEQKPEEPQKPQKPESGWMTDDDFEDISDPDDLGIQWNPKKTGKDKKNEKEKKQPKEKKESKSGLLGGFFGKKEKPSKPASDDREIFKGAAVEDLPVKEQRKVEEPVRQQAVTYQDDYDEKTQVQTKAPGKTSLINIGDSQLPSVIEIHATPDKVFKIGRFDISIGKKQSDFEFDKNTKEVSRHHAVIEFRNGEYYIVDLNSSAGTMLNGKRIPANKPQMLQEGMKVSFGSAGADYVFRK